VLEPDVTGYRYDDFEHSALLVRIGEAATRAALPEIRKWLEPAAQEKQRIGERRRARRTSGHASWFVDTHSRSSPIQKFCRRGDYFYGKVCCWFLGLVTGWRHPFEAASGRSSG